MSETQNTPHAQLHIVVEQDLKVLENGTLNNGTAEFDGCPYCMAEAIAQHMAAHEKFKHIIYNALFICTIKSATKPKE